MSNVVFRGDSVKNFGEYLPAPYIEKITVTTGGGGLLDFELQFSVIFHVEDDGAVANVANILEDTSFFYAWGFHEEDKPETKNKIISIAGDVTAGRIAPINNIPDGTFALSEEELYDSEDRRVVKYTITTSLGFSYYEAASFAKDNPEDAAGDYNKYNIYLYLFSGPKEIEGATDSAHRGGTSKSLLTTSNIAYEKVMSKNRTIKKDERFVYFDQEGSKYSQVPLLGLDRNFYKADGALRRLIIQRVRRLANRFKGGSAPGLNDAVTSIEYVLSTEAETENLLVQLDKVRRGFPNKTNNNPTGNLYASFAILLQNINSSFPATDRLVKDKYLTGKVYDLRTPSSVNAGEDSRTEGNLTGRYINTPLVDRKIQYAENFRSELDETGKAFNTGIVLFDYERLVKEKAQIFIYFNVDRFFEVCPTSQLAAYKAALFSKFKIQKLETAFCTHGWSPDKPFIDITLPNRLFTHSYEVSGFFSEAPAEINNSLTIKIEEDPARGGGYTSPSSNKLPVLTDVTLLNYNLIDSGKQMFAIKYEYTDFLVGSEYSNDLGLGYETIGQRYVCRFSFKDYTINMIHDYITQYETALEKLEIYLEQAEEECSFNNITTSFNNFFDKSVKAYWESEDYTYPWELAPTILSVFSYLRTDQFDSLEKARLYANEVMYNISPETGNLEQLRLFVNTMSDFADDVISPLEDEMGDRITSLDVEGVGIMNITTDTEQFLSQQIDEVAYSAMKETVESGPTEADDSGGDV